MMTRREVITSVGVTVGTVLGSTTLARAQTETQTGGEAQITRMAVIPQVGAPFEGNYTGQFVIFTDPTPRNDVSPEVVAECDIVNWAPEQTRGYEVLIADRLTDEPRGTTVQAFLNGNKPQIDVGQAFIIDRTHACPGGFLKLELEGVPVKTFNPEYGTEVNPAVGESPGPTVSPTSDQTEEPGIIDAPGQPGFGLLAAIAGLSGAAFLRRLVRRS